MLEKRELIQRIKDYFELNDYETKVWLALIAKGVASAGEIAEVSRVPRSRTYDVLESLEKKGFAIVKLGKPVKYIGIKPSVIIEKIKNNVIKEAHEKAESLSKIKNTEEFRELEKIYNIGINPIKKEDISGLLKGKSSISNQVRESLKNANKEVIICTSAKDIASKFKLFEETIKKLTLNGIKVKIGLFGDEDIIKKLESKLGIKIKKINFKSKFYIIDRKEIIFYIFDEENNNEDAAIWINSEFFSESFATLFENAIKSS